MQQKNNKQINRITYRLMVLFCKDKDVSRENRQFTVGSDWKAPVILDHDTPFSLGLKDGDEIFVRHLFPTTQ